MRVLQLPLPTRLSGGQNDPLVCVCVLCIHSSAYLGRSYAPVWLPLISEFMLVNSACLSGACWDVLTHTPFCPHSLHTSLTHCNWTPDTFAPVAWHRTALQAGVSVDVTGRSVWRFLGKLLFWAPSLSSSPTLMPAPTAHSPQSPLGCMYNMIAKQTCVGDHKVCM